MWHVVFAVELDKVVEEERTIVMKIELCSCRSKIKKTLKEKWEESCE